MAQPSKLPWYMRDFGEDEHLVDFLLEKNLAGHEGHISGEEFIRWAEAGEAPDEGAAWVLCEALEILSGIDVLGVYLDGRTEPENIARLMVSCGADKGDAWNNLIRTFHPDLPVQDPHPGLEMREKAIVADWTCEDIERA